MVWQHGRDGLSRLQFDVSQQHAHAPVRQAHRAYDLQFQQFVPHTVFLGVSRSKAVLCFRFGFKGIVLLWLDVFWRFFLWQHELVLDAFSFFPLFRPRLLGVQRQGHGSKAEAK